MIREVWLGEPLACILGEDKRNAAIGGILPILG